MEIAKLFGAKIVVAINSFASDTQAELDMVQQAALTGGAKAAVVCTHWADGGRGAEELAEAVISTCQTGSEMKLPYSLDMPIKEKIEAVAKQVYLAGHVVYQSKADKQIATYQQTGMNDMAVCMAKTQFSLSHDPKLRGVPRGYELPIREVRIAAGAGFVCPLVGDIRTMPGLGSHTAFMDIDIDDNGEVVGMF